MYDIITVNGYTVWWNPIKWRYTTQYDSAFTTVNRKLPLARWRVAVDVAPD